MDAAAAAAASIRPAPVRPSSISAMAVAVLDGLVGHLAPGEATRLLDLLSRFTYPGTEE